MYYCGGVVGICRWQGDGIEPKFVALSTDRLAREGGLSLREKLCLWTLFALQVLVEAGGKVGDQKLEYRGDGQKRTKHSIPRVLFRVHGWLVSFWRDDHVDGKPQADGRSRNEGKMWRCDTEIDRRYREQGATRTSDDQGSPLLSSLSSGESLASICTLFTYIWSQGLRPYRSGLQLAALALWGAWTSNDLLYAMQR